MFGRLHSIVEVGIQTRAILVLGVFTVLVFLVALLTSQPLEEVGNLLIIQRIVDRLVHTLESTEAALAILSTVTDIRSSSHRVGFVGIGGKHGIHAESITLGQLDTQRGIQITPRTLLGSKVIAHRSTQLVNQANLLKAR